MMDKIGQNDSCPCGSGLKYKKCCGKSNVIPFNPLQLESEMEKLHKELIEFAIKNYEKNIDNVIFDEIDSYLPDADDEALEGYAALLLPWVALNEPIIGEQTIFHIFAKQKIKKIRNSKMKEALLSWEYASSAIFEVLEIDNDKNGNLIVQNLFTNDIYGVFIETDADYNVGDYIIGTLANFIHSYQFLFLTSHVPKENIDLVTDLLEDYDLDHEPMNELFPEWLSEIIYPSHNELEWIDEKHEIVAEEFAMHMEIKDVDEKAIALGILFWNIYCSKYNPKIVKVNTYVASLEYFISLSLLEDFSVTQSEIAKKYNVSTTTISSHWNKFVQELEQYSLYED